MSETVQLHPRLGKSPSGVACRDGGLSSLRPSGSVSVLVEALVRACWLDSPAGVCDRLQISPLSAADVLRADGWAGLAEAFERVAERRRRVAVAARRLAEAKAECDRLAAEYLRAVAAL